MTELTLGAKLSPSSCGLYVMTRALTLGCPSEITTADVAMGEMFKHLHFHWSLLSFLVNKIQLDACNCVRKEHNTKLVQSLYSGCGRSVGKKADFTSFLSHTTMHILQLIVHSLHSNVEKKKLRTCLFSTLILAQTNNAKLGARYSVGTCTGASGKGSLTGSFRPGKEGFAPSPLLSSSSS